jgi:predicted ATPase
MQSFTELELDTADPHEIRRRAFLALRDLLARLAARAPLVVHVDDGQWGDADSALLLGEVLRAPAPPVLLIVSHRSEEANAPFLELLRAAHKEAIALPVGPLSYADATALAAAVLPAGDIGGAVAGLVARESRGNAFFVTELARWVDAGGGKAAAPAHQVSASTAKTRRRGAF